MAKLLTGTPRRVSSIHIRHDPHEPHWDPASWIPQALAAPSAQRPILLATVLAGSAVVPSSLASPYLCRPPHPPLPGCCCPRLPVDCRHSTHPLVPPAPLRPSRLFIAAVAVAPGGGAGGLLSHVPPSEPCAGIGSAPACRRLLFELGSGAMRLGLLEGHRRLAPGSSGLPCDEPGFASGTECHVVLWGLEETWQALRARGLVIVASSRALG